MMGQLHEFRPEQEQFMVYLERVQIFFAANDIPPEKHSGDGHHGEGVYGELRGGLSETKRAWSNAQEREMLFFHKSVEYLGRVIDAKHTPRRKLQAVLDTQALENVHKLRSVLGTINYYDNFIPDLSSLLHPLHRLLRVNQPWHRNVNQR